MAGTFLFDMDGLLLDTERLYQSAFCAALRDQGLARDTDAAFFLTLVGSSHTMTEAAVRAYVPSHADLSQLFDGWRDHATQLLAKDVPVKSGVADNLARLQSMGAQMGVVTSTHHNHAVENLDRAGLLAFFSFVKGGDQVTANKPEPAPYLEGAAEFGIPADQCFAFEDSDRGITSAIRAGCRAVQIPDLRPPHTPFPDLGQHIAEDLGDALRHLGLL